MITFITLFLGLITGPHQVEIAAGDPVAAVELLLDGEPCAVDREDARQRALDREDARQRALSGGSPWSVPCDFGTELRPHRLTAIARNDAGEEIERIDQWINLPRSRVEAGLVIETGADGGKRARVVWASMEQERPLSMHVTLDGSPLAADADGSYPLPPMNERDVHVLHAELAFPGDERGSVHAVIGGELGEGVNVEMTAVPVRPRGREEPTIASLGSSFLVGQEPAEVMAVERGGSDVVVVIEASAVTSLGGYGRALDVSPQYARTGIALDAGDGIRFMSAEPTRVASGTLPYDLFPMSTPFTGEDGELPYLLTHINLGSTGAGQRLADAVATAGVQAAAGNERRAVLLILGHRWEDESLISPEEAKRYLESLRVPLVVWTTGAAESRRISEDRRPITIRTEWGTARNVSSVNRLLASAGELRQTLAEQRIVWVEGQHLPRAIQLAKGARGVELDR